MDFIFLVVGLSVFTALLIGVVLCVGRGAEYIRLNQRVLHVSLMRMFVLGDEARAGFL